MDGAALSAESQRFECGVCWQVYDPVAGDPLRGVAPGTAFADLPADWACPHCDAAAARFFPTTREGGGAAARGEGNGLGAVAATDAQGVAWAIESALRRVAAGGMAALPISNPALNVEALGFVRVGGLAMAAVITPWSMQLLAAPLGPAPAWTSGSLVELPLPSGRYDFMAGSLDGVGTILSLSLFSPMNGFADMASARAAARAALDEVLGSAAATDRRGLFGRAAEAA